LALRYNERSNQGMIGLSEDVKKPTADFFFFFLGLAASPDSGAAGDSTFGGSPFASASETSPGTALLPRLPGRLFAFFSFFSLSF